MPLRGVLVLAGTWVFFAAVVFAQFCFIALVPVLAPIYAMQVIGAACLLTHAYAYARSLPRYEARRGVLGAPTTASQKLRISFHEA
jgi:hypothetical protein